MQPKVGKITNSIKSIYVSLTADTDNSEIIIYLFGASQPITCRKPNLKTKVMNEYFLMRKEREVKKKSLKRNVEAIENLFKIKSTKLKCLWKI